MGLKKFIAYYRVSTDKQGRSGLGLEAQQQAVHFFLQG
jgi:DNA invertase Pin-like site-specific DNA recombinase